MRARSLLKCSVPVCCIAVSLNACSGFDGPEPSATPAALAFLAPKAKLHVIQSGAESGGKLPFDVKITLDPPPGGTTGLYDDVPQSVDEIRVLSGVGLNTFTWAPVKGAAIRTEAANDSPSAKKYSEAFTVDVSGATPNAEVRVYFRGKGESDYHVFSPFIGVWLVATKPEVDLSGLVGIDIAGTTDSKVFVDIFDQTAWSDATSARLTFPKLSIFSTYTTTYKSSSGVRVSMEFLLTGGASAVKQIVDTAVRQYAGRLERTDAKRAPPVEVRYSLEAFQSVDPDRPMPKGDPGEPPPDPPAPRSPNDAFCATLDGNDAASVTAGRDLTRVRLVKISVDEREFVTRATNDACPHNGEGTFAVTALPLGCSFEVAEFLNSSCKCTVEDSKATKVEPSKRHLRCAAL